jgi:hypothetical protein
MIGLKSIFSTVKSLVFDGFVLAILAILTFWAIHFLTDEIKNEFNNNNYSGYSFKIRTNNSHSTNLTKGKDKSELSETFEINRSEFSFNNEIPCVGSGLLESREINVPVAKYQVNSSLFFFKNSCYLLNLYSKSTRLICYDSFLVIHFQETTPVLRIWFFFFYLPFFFISIISGFAINTGLFGI